MTKKYVIWVCGKSNDQYAANRAFDLRSVLNDPMKWTEIDYKDNGTIKQLEDALDMVNPQQGDDILIWIHDYGQLVNGLPSVTCDLDENDPNTYISLADIENRFINKSFNHLTILLQGKGAGINQMNYGQLIQGGKGVTIASSMGPYELHGNDAFDIAYQLPGPNSDYNDIYQAIMRELSVMLNLPEEVRQHGAVHYQHP